MEKIVKQELFPGVQLICLPTDRFKTGCLSITFRRPLLYQEVSMNALCAPILLRGTGKYPTMQALTAAAEELYGAEIGPVLRRRGTSQCFGLAADFIDGRFAPGGEDILKGIVELMASLLLDSAGDEDSFVKEYFLTERKNLERTIDSRINDKGAWSHRRLLELMCPNEPYAIDLLGSHSELARLDEKTLRAHWKKVLSEAPVLIYYGGSESPERVAELFKTNFASLAHRSAPTPAVPPVIGKAPEEPRFHEHTMPVMQSRLCMGWRFETDKPLEYAPGVVFNTLFGGSSGSKLFLNVREKLSLCYSVDSEIDRRAALMFASAGVEDEDTQVCMEEIIAQLEACAKKEISEQELDNAKACIINALELTADSPGSLESYYTTKAWWGESMRIPSEAIPEVEAVTVDDVARIASMARLDTVFVLHGEVEE